MNGRKMQTMVYLMVHHSVNVCARVFAAAISFARTSAKALRLRPKAPQYSR
jgi:hypothetical protein